MSRQEALTAYAKAQRAAQKEYKERLQAGLSPYPAVLDDILPPSATPPAVQDIGLVEIPANRIVGVKSAGRITAFSASFLPLLDYET